MSEIADRVRTRFGATTFAQRRVRQAENAVALASAELNAARTAEAEEREAAREQEAKKQGADT